MMVNILVPILMFMDEEYLYSYTLIQNTTITTPFGRNIKFW